MGEWNAVAGEEENGSVIGKYGLGRKNERGELLSFVRKPSCGNQLWQTQLFRATHGKKIYLEKSRRKIEQINWIIYLREHDTGISTTTR